MSQNNAEASFNRLSKLRLLELLINRSYYFISEGCLGQLYIHFFKSSEVADLLNIYQLLYKATV